MIAAEINLPVFISLLYSLLTLVIFSNFWYQNAGRFHVNPKARQHIRCRVCHWSHVPCPWSGLFLPELLIWHLIRGISVFRAECFATYSANLPFTWMESFNFWNITIQLGHLWRRELLARFTICKLKAIKACSEDSSVVVSVTNIIPLGP